MILYYLSGVLYQEQIAQTLGNTVISEGDYHST